MMLGGRVGIDIKGKRAWRGTNSRDKLQMMLGGRVGKDFKEGLGVGQSQQLNAQRTRKFKVFLYMFNCAKIY